MLYYRPPGTLGGLYCINTIHMNHIVHRHIAYVGIAIGALALVTSASVADAQEGIAVKIAPSTVDEQLDPGTVAEGVLTVTNQNGGRQTYYLGTRNITGMSDEGRPTFSEEDVDVDDQWSAASWIEPLIDDITLDVDQSGNIPYRITIPEEASPGSYFVSIFVTREAEAAQESGAGVGFHVAALFHIRVAGAATESMLVREFSTDRTLYSSVGTTFTTRVENTGTVHQRPRGIITITDMLGNEAAQIPVNEQAGGVMPRTERVFSVEWNPESFTIGRYHAMLSVSFGERQKQTTTKEISFWVVPLKEVAYMLGGIALFILLVLAGLKMYVRRALKRAGVNARPVAQQRAQTLSRRLMRTFAVMVVLMGLLFIVIIVLNV